MPACVKCHRMLWHGCRRCPDCSAEQPTRQCAEHEHGQEELDANERAKIREQREYENATRQCADCICGHRRSFHDTDGCTVPVKGGLCPGPCDGGDRGADEFLYDGSFNLTFLRDGETVGSAADGTGACYVTQPTGPGQVYSQRVEVGQIVTRGQGGLILAYTPEGAEVPGGA